MPRYELSFLQNVRQQTPHTPTAVDSLAQLAEVFDGFAARSAARKEDCAALTGCCFAGDSRELAAAQEVSIAALDVDEIPDLDRLFDALAPFEYLAHETHSSTPEAPRYHVWLSIDHPIPAGTYKDAYRGFREVIPYLDPVCTNANRFHYMPSNGVEILHNQGRPFPVKFSPEDPREAAPSHTVSRAELRRYARVLEGARSSKRKAFGTILGHVCDGVRYADEGHRDDVTYRLAWYLALKWPHAEPKSLAKQFSRSLELMGGLTVEDVAAKIERQQQSVLEEIEKDADDADKARGYAIGQATGDPGRKHPYSMAELEALASKHHTTTRDLHKQWIIQRGDAFWILTHRGYHQYSLKDAALAAAVQLSPAPLSTYRMTGNAQNPTLEVKTAAQMVTEFGSVAQRTQAHLNLNHSYFDPTAWTYNEACCPLAPLEPLPEDDFSYLQIDTWLQHLSGAQWPLLRKWLYWCTHLSAPCAALFFTGAKGAGKTLIAYGLARLWGEEPTPLSGLMGGFNGAITRCPLALADETVPKDFQGNVRSEELREIIQARSRPLRRKYMADATLHGAIRMIVTGNNEELLSFKHASQALTQDDIFAISERIIHIQAPPAAQLYLDALPQGTTQRWVEQSLIARYALAVQRKETYLPDGRFLVKQHSDLVYRTIITSSHSKYTLLRWLHDVITSPAQCVTLTGLSDHLHVSDAGVFVHFRAVEMTWDLYLKSEKRPSAMQISKELAALSTGRSKIPGTGRNAHKIELRHVLAWVDRDGSCTVEEFKLLVNQGVDFRDVRELQQRVN